MKSSWPEGWTVSEIDTDLNPHLEEIPTIKSPIYLDIVHKCFEQTTRYILSSLNQTWSTRKRSGLSTYFVLLSAHFRFAVFARPDDRNRAMRESFDGRLDGRLDEIPIFATNIKAHLTLFPTILRNLKREHKPNTAAADEEVFDMWMTMLFRACCWGACHSFVPGERVPLENYGSQLPVYIG